MLLQANALSYRVQTSLVRRSLDCSVRLDVPAKFPRDGGGSKTKLTHRSICCRFSLFMPPTLEKLKGILLLACQCVRASIRPSVTKFIKIQF